MDFIKKINLFPEQHPIQNMLANPVWISLFSIVVILLIITLITLAKVKQSIPIWFMYVMLVTMLIETTSVVTLTIKNTDGEALLYQSHVTVKHIDPVDENNKQRVILQQNHTERVFNISRQDAKNLKANDHIILNIVYQPKETAFSMADYDPKMEKMKDNYGNYNKHIPFKDIEFNENWKIKDIDKE